MIELWLWYANPKPEMAALAVKEVKMKRYFIVLLFACLCLVLSALSIENIRTAQNIRYAGIGATSSLGEHWVVWDDYTAERYQLMVQKFNQQGNPVFAEPLTIPTGQIEVKLLDCVVTSDNGIVVLYMQETGQYDAVFTAQKLNSSGTPLWDEDGIILAGVQFIKYPSFGICENNLGGAFFLLEGEYHTDTTDYIVRNLNGDGQNIWTAPAEIPIDSYANFRQILQTDSGEFILNFLSYQNPPYIIKVDNYGNTIGNDPMFDSSAVIPDNPYLVKSTEGKILMYSSNAASANNLQLQMMDAEANLLYNNLVQIPMGGDSWEGLKIKSDNEGGFYLSYLSADLSSSYDMKKICAQRLDEDLEPMWGMANPVVFAIESYLYQNDMLLDADDNIWVTVVSTDLYYRDEQVKLIALNPSGEELFPPISISHAQGIKTKPRLFDLGGSALLCWGDYYDGMVLLQRQVISDSGDQLLPQNGVPIFSHLNGSGEVYGFYSLGERSICIFHDNRSINPQIYYQIVDHNLNQYLPQNGQALNPDEDDYQKPIAAAVSPQNTLYLLYYKETDSDSLRLHLQEINADGSVVYPNGGLLLYDGERTYLGSIGFEDNAAYVYWEQRVSELRYTTALKAQKIENGSLQWESNGKTIYSDLTRNIIDVQAQGRFFALITRNNDAAFSELRAYRLQENGDLDADWDPSGYLICDTQGYTNLPALTGRIGDDFFCFGAQNGAEFSKIVGQRLDLSGNRLWGDDGQFLVTIDQDCSIFFRSSSFNEYISILYDAYPDGIFLQKLDIDANLQFEGQGITLPGNSIYNIEQPCFEYDNGCYSYFWTEWDNMNHVSNLMHVIISPCGILQNTQTLESGRLIGFKTVNCSNHAMPLWSHTNNDIFSYEEMPLNTISVTALPEPIGNIDPTQEDSPGLILNQNYPNPFKSSTRISLKLANAAPITLQIYNIKGQKVQQYKLPYKAAGDYSVEWDGRDSQGRLCAAGLYLYKVRAGKYSARRKMILLK